MPEPRRLVALVAVAAALSACTTSGSTRTPSRSPAMTHEASRRSNKEVVRSLYEQSLNTGDKEVLERSIAPDFVGPRGDAGPAAFGRTVDELRAAFPDIHYTVEDLLEEGDRVAIRWTWTGTHAGPFRGLAPTGKRISNPGFAIFQLRDGKIVRSWLETDRFGFLQQIGAIPPELGARVRPGASAGR